MRFAFTDDQLAFRDAVRDLLAKECTPARRARRVGRRRPGASPGVWDAARRDGRARHARARGRRRARARRARPRARRSRRPGRAALPEPARRDAPWSRVPLLGDPARAPPATIAVTDARRSVRAVRRRRPTDRCSTTATGSRGRPAPTPMLAPATVGRRRAAPASGRVATPATPSTDDAARSRWRSTAARSAPPRSSSASAGRMLDLTVDYAKERQQFGVPDRHASRR